jgi:uncharacterized protein (TIGR03086 family)
MVVDMTHTTSTHTTDTSSIDASIHATIDAAPLAADDPRRWFAHAVATAGATIAGVRNDQFTITTPCTAYDVRAMLGHLLAVMHRLAAVGAGGSPFDVPQVVELGDDATVDEWGAAWTEAAHRVQEVWTAEVLDHLITVPWAQLPGRVTMAIYTNEVTVHTWDLATATGQSPDWHEPTIAAAYEAIRIGLPAEGRTASFDAAISQMDESVRDEVVAEGTPFAEVVDVAGDAPLIDRLVAWNGRHP